MQKEPERFSGAAVLSLHWQHAPIPIEGIRVVREEGGDLLLVPVGVVPALNELAAPAQKLSELPIEDECGAGFNPGYI